MRASTTFRALILSLGATFALNGCVQSAPTSGARSRTSAAAEAQTPDSVPEPGYTVDVELPQQTTPGQESIARVRVQPKSPWHMNLDYPAKLRLEAPADVKLDAPQLTKGDAERYDDDALVFSVLFTPEAKGARKIHAQVDFAVCGDAACGSVTESVELAFEAQCRTEDTGLC